ncbi:MAG: response regulator, partial [Bacteroidia bacterium]|nr:response regulator [Bacteroidia bacterium]
LQSNNIRTIIQGRDSTLWIGTEDKGLALFNQSSRDFVQFDDQAIAKIKSLYLDPPLLWIGTNGNGLQLLDTETNKLRGFTTEHGLPNNVIYGVLPDKEGNLWLSSNRGLTKFRWSPEMEAPEITNYDSGDGLQAMEFNTGAYYASREGTLYFGGLNGINWFKPNELGGNPTPPNTAIYEMEVFTETVPMTNGLKLPYDENTLSFSFSALHFSQPQNNMFKYRLTNYEEEWSRPSTVNTAHYPKLPAGSYVFEVVSSNNEDIWDESPATFSFTIKPVWYLTAIAKAGYVLLALLLFYFGYRYLKWRWKVKLQLEMEHEETERLRKLDELKSKLYTNISHEFRTPLTLISAPVQQLMESSGLKENDRRSLKVIEGSSKRMLRLVNQLLDLSKLERGSVQLQVGRHALKPQLLQLVEAFNLKAEQKGVLLNCQVDDFNDPYYDKDVVEKIVSNLLSNAIKYAPDDSTVEFSAEAKDGLLLLKTVNENYTLSESDIGRIFERFYQADKNSKGVGIGLALIKELALLSNGAVRAKKESPNSISFQVEIPIRRSYYNENSIVTPAEIIEFETFTSEENLETDEAIQLLVVEDNEEIRAYIASLFIDNFEVTQAADGLEGLEAALKVIPDLVISDIMMPNKDGIELCNELKSDQRTSHIPVVLLTAKSGGSNVLKGLKNKADDYIVKPFNAEVLRQKVINLINTRKQLRDRYSKNTFLQPKDIAFTPVDESFLETVQQIMNGHMTDPDFNAEKFAAGLAMSRMQLHRKIKALTSLSTTEFIRSQRLKAATKLLAESGLTINEVAYSVGFNTPSYFIKCFKETYGKTPSEYVKT